MNWQTEYNKEEIDEKLGRVKNIRLRERIKDVIEWGKEKRTVGRWAVGYITGHLGSREYLSKHGKMENNKCKSGKIESIHHLPWECREHAGVREEMRTKMGQVTDERYIANRKAYDAIRWAVREIMNKVSKDHRG